MYGTYGISAMQEQLPRNLQVQNTDHNKLIQQGFNTVASVCDHSSLTFSPMADIFIKRFESTGRVVPPLSWRHLATEELINEQFSAVGITKIEIHHEPLGYQMTDSQMWWDVVWNAGWRALLNQMTEDEQIEFEKVHREEISDMLGNGGVWFNTEVLIAVGEK